MALQPTGNVLLATSFGTHNNESDKNGNDGGNVVICTICIDPVIENGPRAVVRLGCGHRFHLDCIGSEFNARGIMRCPNCRVIEVGEWRFSNGQCTHNANDNQAQVLVEVPSAFLPWCPILRPFTYGPSGYGPSGYGPSGYGSSGYGPSGYGPSGYGPYEVWGLPSHGYGPTFSHRWDLLPPPSNAPGQYFPAIGLPTINGSWDNFTPTSENFTWANGTVPSMMGWSRVAYGEAPSLQSVIDPVTLNHGFRFARPDSMASSSNSSHPLPHIGI